MTDNASDALGGAPRRVWLSVVVAAAAAAWAFACEGVTVTSVEVATVSVTPSTATLAPGETVQLSGTVRDAEGNVLTGRSIVWTSGATGVAGVGSTGLVTAVAAGTATIQAAVGSVFGTATITVRQTTTGRILLDRPLVTLTARAGSTAPLVETVVVAAEGGSVIRGLAAAVSYPAGQPSGWLTATLDSPSTPAALRLEAAPGGLPEGSFSATIDVTGDGANAATLVVTLVIAADPPVIGLSLTGVTWTASEGGPSPPPQPIDVDNVGGGTLSGLQVSVSYPAGSATGWVSARLDATTAPTRLILTPTTQGLPIGSYAATVSVAASTALNSPQIVSVALEVAGAGPAIAVFPATLAFTAFLGQGDPAPQSLQVTNAGSGSLTGLGSAVSYAPGEPTGWLLATLSGTVAPATLDARLDVSGLALGTYSATIELVSADASNSPRLVPVRLDVVSPPTIGVNPGSATFSASQGGANPAPQLLSVQNLGGTTLDGLSRAVSYAAGQPTGWLTAALGATSAPTSLTLSVAVGALTQGAYDATVTVTSTAAGVTNSPFTVPVRFNVGAMPVADLFVTKTDGRATVHRGSGLTYTVQVGNLGPDAANGALVNDALPAGLSGATWTCSTAGGATCPASGSGDLQNVSVGLPAGGTATFSISATATGTGQVVNTATVTAPASVQDPVGSNDSDSDTTEILIPVDLAVTKTDGVTSVLQGNSVTYTIVASNSGPNAVTGAVLDDTFPPGLSGVTWTCAPSGGASCPASGSGTIQASLTLPPGGSATFTATGTATGTGTLSNTAQVSVPAGFVDTNGSNDSATDSNTQIQANSDVSVTKTDGVTSVVQGSTITYTIVVSNAGPSSVTGVTVTDNLPAALTSATWTCSASGGASCAASGSGSLSESVGLPTGGSVTFSLTATASGSGTISNTATATLPGGVTDPAPGNNSATDSNTQITPAADLSISKTDGVTTVAQGNAVTYTIVASNAGPSGVTGATVSDNFPGQLSGVTWTCAASAGSSCPASGSGNINALVNVLAGGSATFTATGTASGSGTLSNTATVTVPAGVADPVAGNNSATDSDTQIQPAADLSITKTDGVTSVSQGASVTYTIVVSNGGPSAVVGAQVNDAFPAQLSPVTWTCSPSAGSSCPAASGSGDLNAASVNLPSGGSVTFSATGTVVGTGTLSNTATVTTPAGVTDPVPGNNSATDANTVIQATANLGITKSDGVTSVVQGNAVTYTIVASNAGPGAVTGATVSDNFPPALTGVTWSCSGSGGGVCPASGAGNLAATVDLPSGGSVTFSATGTASGSGTLSNTATITPPAGVTDPTPANNSATDANTTIQPAADLSITKTDGVTSVNEGGSVTYTIAASNAGPSAVTNATVTDNFPGSVTGVTWTCAGAGGGACPASGSGNLSASVNLPVGATVTFSATGTVSGSGTISNTASVAVPAGVVDPASGNNSATDADTQIQATADLAITKTDGVTSVNQGSTVTYTIVASNASGPSAVTGATVTDVFPGALTGVTWTCSGAGGGTCPASGSGNLSASVNLPVGGSVTFLATGTASGTGTLSNTATVSPPAGVADPTPGNDSATDSNTQIQATADLSVTKTDGTTSVLQGGSVTYTITVANAGPSAVTGATVADNFPAGLTGVTWTCAASGGSSCSASGSGNINQIVNLASGGSVTFSATGTATGSGTLSNTATVSAPAGVTDPVPGNNSATDADTQIQPAADLSITKSDGVTSVVQGSSVTYTIVASNASGPSPVTGATVTDNFPAAVTGVTWTCSGSGGGSCPASGSGNLSASVNLPVGGSVTFSATGTATGTGTISNTATVAAPGGVTDPTPGNDSATDADTQIQIQADLSVTKTDGVTSVNQGSTLTYTIVASNASGPSAVTGATVTDNFPAGVTGVTWTCAGSGGGVCPASGSGNLSASVDLPVGASVTFMATGTASGTGTLSNTATVAPPAGVTDPAPGNDSASDSDTQIQASADLAITKTDGVTSVVQGSTVTYTIVASNPSGPSGVTGATVTDVFPGSVTGVTWTCAGSGGGTCPASGSGNLSESVNLPVGGSVTFTATGTASGSGTISNTASVAPPAGVTDPNAANDSATDANTQIQPAADLSVTKTDGESVATVGQMLTYTIVVSNAGPSGVTGATVTDNFPAELGAITWTCSGSGGGVCAASGAGNLSELVNLPVGASVTFLVDATVLAVGTIQNTATVAPPAGVVDPAAGNDSATDVTTAS